MGKEDGKSLNYIGIIRLTDRCLLASYPETPPRESRKDIQSIFNNIYKDSVKSIKNNTKKYLDSANGRLYFITNSLKTIVIFVYSKDAEFPKRIASKLLKDYANSIDSVIGDSDLVTAKKYSLSSKLKDVSIQLLKNYCDYKNKDPTAKAKENVDGILDHFTDDVNKLIESYGIIEDLKSKSVNLQKQAAKFSSATTSVKRSYRRQYLSHIIILVIIALVFILYFTIPLFTNSSGESTNVDNVEFGHDHNMSLRGPIS